MDIYGMHPNYFFIQTKKTFGQHCSVLLTWILYINAEGIFMPGECRVAVKKILLCGCTFTHDEKRVILRFLIQLPAHSSEREICTKLF